MQPAPVGEEAVSMRMLEGIRIVDLTTVIFGPYATQMLADLGAEVIKVEAPGGDVSRYLGRSAKTPGSGSTHLTVNRGKKSVVLDLKQPDDAKVLANLIKTADVVVHNVRAKAIERLGFGYAECRALKEDIIYLHCAGFGQDGPYADYPAYDDVIQAGSGICSLASRVDGNPQPRYVASVIADKVSGHYCAQAILVALIHRLRTGEGQQVEVPMFEAFTNFVLEEHLQDATTIPPLGPICYPRQIDPARQPFPTQDGYLSIIPYTDAKMVELFDLLGAPGLLAKEGLDSQPARAAAPTRLYELIAALTPSRTTQQWLDVLTPAQFPAIPAYDIADVFTDPHFLATGFFREVEHPSEGRYRQMQPPLRFSADPDRKIGHAPNLDADGPAIRAEFGG